MRLSIRAMKKSSREARRRSAEKKAGVVPAFYSSLKPASLVLHPDFHPGYANKKGSGTPTSAVSGRHPRHAGRCCHRPRASGAARLSAFHRGSGLGDRTPLPSFSSALPELVPLSGRYPRTGQPQCSDASRRPVVMPVGRTTRSRPGADCKSARGYRTRPALWPAGHSASE